MHHSPLSLVAAKRRNTSEDLWMGKKARNVLWQLVYVQSGAQTSDNGWSTVEVEKNDRLAYISMLAPCSIYMSMLSM